MPARVPIGVTLSFAPPKPRRLFSGKALQYLEEGMIDALVAAGGAPLLLPATREPDCVPVLLAACRGLLLSGGEDVAPQTYGEAPARAEWAGAPRRDRYELALFTEARRRGLPVLGVCRGCQLLNVAFGGTLWQDLESEREDSLRHRNQELYDALEHAVHLPPGGTLSGVFGTTELRVNSVHHQGIKRLGEGLRPLAFAPDGLIEAIESDDGLVLGVQWHPEWRERPDPLLAYFVERAR